MLITQKFGTWLGACIFWIACVDRLEAREPDPAPHTPSLAVRFREYRMDPAAPWRDMYAYTLNVLCVRISRVVWSRAGEAPRKPGSALVAGNFGGLQFTCDASSTVAEICIQEPASPTTQAASKSTCLSTKGVWSEAGQCPSGYKKKCADGDQTNYYYGSGDQNKSCSQLVAFEFSFSSRSPEVAAQSRAP